MKVIGNRTYALCALAGVLLVSAVAATVLGDEATASVCRSGAEGAMVAAVAALRASK